MAHNVHKRYGRKRILTGVELVVPQGEVMALLGANGAGKSTLMRIISGLAKPDRGEVILGLFLPVQRPATKSGVTSGWWRTCCCFTTTSARLDNLMFYAQLYDIQQPAQRVEAVLHAVELCAVLLRCRAHLQPWDDEMFRHRACHFAPPASAAAR